MADDRVKRGAKRKPEEGIIYAFITVKCIECEIFGQSDFEALGAMQ